MGVFLLSLAGLMVAILMIKLYTVHRRHKRAAFIDAYRFPQTVSERVREKYPHLNSDEVSLVIKGLREYFHLCNLAGRRMVAMPSQVVDIAWHEFILFTRDYKTFCQQAFGRFLHHTPAEAMRSRTSAQAGIKRAWRLACLRAFIMPRDPSKLPLLFALDVRLKIPDGFTYSLDCQKSGNNQYCAAHIGCGGGCGGGCHGGCSGSGCSGGCGGD
jgi:hypothetical protein